MTKQDRIKQALRIRKRFEKDFRPSLKRVLKDHYSSYTSLLKSHGVAYVLNHPNVNLIDGQLAGVVQQLYIRSGLARAQLTYRELNRLPRVEKKSGAIGFNAQWTSDIISYFRMSLFDKTVLPISQTTQEYILAVLQKGVNEGWGIEKMVQEIEREDYLDGRVEMILRTELTRAINYGNVVASNTYDYKTKKGWTAIHDARTRGSHREADGQEVYIDEKFLVRASGVYDVFEKMDFPGDPTASAYNTVNCRCATYIVAVRDARGRLVPKETQEPKPRLAPGLRSRIQEAIDALS